MDLPPCQGDQCYSRVRRGDRRQREAAKGWQFEHPGPQECRLVAPESPNLRPMSQGITPQAIRGQPSGTPWETCHRGVPGPLTGQGSPCCRWEPSVQSEGPMGCAWCSTAPIAKVQDLNPIRGQQEGCPERLPLQLSRIGWAESCSTAPL